MVNIDMVDIHMTTCSYPLMSLCMIPCYMIWDYAYNTYQTYLHTYV